MLWMGGAPCSPTGAVGFAGIAGRQQDEPTGSLLDDFRPGSGGATVAHGCPMRMQCVSACSMYFFTMLTDTLRISAISA